MKSIEVTIRPYSARREELQVGRLIDGQFVQEKGIWNVLKDARLSVKRAYEGRGAQQDVTFNVQVPEQYPLVIARAEVCNFHLTTVDRKFTVLYQPIVAGAKVLSFGKHAGKKLSEVPLAYLKWLVIHANVLKAENRVIVESAKAVLVAKEAALAA